MFFCLVKDTLDAFHFVTASSICQMETEKEYNPFDADWAMFWVDFIYEHHDGVKLLICCIPGGSRYTDCNRVSLTGKQERKQQRDPA